MGGRRMDGWMGGGWMDGRGIYFTYSILFYLLDSIHAFITEGMLV